MGNSSNLLDICGGSSSKSDFFSAVAAQGHQSEIVLILLFWFLEEVKWQCTDCLVLILSGTVPSILD